uniref:Uncharacterized protein n=1 Tax=Parascaris univalens TaxID=6257 RepID=A0A915ADE2_PARUN
AELPESIGYGDSGKKESYKERNPPSLQPKRVAYIDSDLSASSYTGAFTPGQDNPQINGKVRNGNGRKSDGVDKGYDESMRESDGNSYDEERGTRNENKQGDLEDDQVSKPNSDGNYSYESSTPVQPNHEAYERSSKPANG